MLSLPDQKGNYRFKAAVDQGVGRNKKDDLGLDLVVGSNRGEEGGGGGGGGGGRGGRGGRDCRSGRGMKYQVGTDC